MLVVSDASVVIAPALCGKLDLLEALFGDVRVPQAVFDELMVPGKPKTAEIAEWARGKVVAVQNTAAVTALSLNLDPGESEALALYWEIAADYLLIDEKRGRTIAARNGIKTIGAAGILLAAKQRGLVAAIKPFLDTLLANDVRISDTLYRQLLVRAGE
jgi:predicted nucleic acid-binding protein